MAYTLAIAGLGAIGLKVARAVDAGAVPGITLTAVSAKDITRGRARVAEVVAVSCASSAATRALRSLAAERAASATS